MNMYVTSYTQNREEFFLVSYNTIDPSDSYKTVGNVVTFKVKNGEFALAWPNANLQFSGAQGCFQTLGIEAADDGSVIAVLCRGHLNKEKKPYHKDALWFVDQGFKYEGSGQNGNWDNCAHWHGRCYPMGWWSDDPEDSPLYLFEYQNGGVKSTTPDKMLLINHAVGGWHYGQQMLRLNKAKSTYFVDLKVTAGPHANNRHQGQTHFGIDRTQEDPKTKSYKWLRLTDGWACGGGHTIMNRIVYNEFTDEWGRLCWTDISLHSIFMTSRDNVGLSLLNAHEKTTYEYEGGTNGLASLGKEGYMVVGVGPGIGAGHLDPPFPGREGLKLGVFNLPQEIAPVIEQRKPFKLPGVKPRHDPSKCQEKGKFDRDCCAAEADAGCADGFIYNYTGKNCVRHYRFGECLDPKSMGLHEQVYSWSWLDTPEPHGDGDKWMGEPKIANFRRMGDRGRLLVGWVPAMPRMGLGSEFWVQEMDYKKNLMGDAMMLQGTGWHEDSDWQFLKASGCVAMVHAWMGNDGPGKTFPVEGAAETTKQLQLTSICPQ
jgi:hypothetical protein